MAQWEYLLQSYSNPLLVVGNLDTRKVERFQTKEQAERVLWRMDCLAAMSLRIIKIPAGTIWDVTDTPPHPIMGINHREEDEDEYGDPYGGR